MMCRGRQVLPVYIMHVWFPRINLHTQLSRERQWNGMWYQMDTTDDDPSDRLRSKTKSLNLMIVMQDDDYYYYYIVYKDYVIEFCYYKNIYISDLYFIVKIFHGFK